MTRVRRAFTLLELLAATTLTALVLVAVLQIIATIGRTRTAESANDRPELHAWRADLIELLRRDLTNANSIRYTAGGIVLSGHGALDRSTLATVDSPVIVTYELAQIRGRSWLCRRQSTRDGGGAPDWSEVVCSDVIQFAVKPAGIGAAQPPVDEKSREGQPIPPVVAVQLDGAGGRILDEVLVLR